MSDQPKCSKQQTTLCILVRDNWPENVTTALSDPTAVGKSNINEWGEFYNVQTTSTSVPDIHSNKIIAENIQNALVSVDRHIDEI